MGDAYLRDLERRASTGDPEAAAALQRERCRLHQHGATAIKARYIGIVGRQLRREGARFIEYANGLQYDAAWPEIQVRSARCATCGQDIDAPTEESIRVAIVRQDVRAPRDTGAFKVVVVPSDGHPPSI